VARVRVALVDEEQRIVAGEQSHNEMTAAYTPVQAARLLAASLTMIKTEVAALPPAVLTYRPAAGEWCVLEVIGHLIETEERGFAGRIRTILAEERPRFSTWDPDAVARARRDDVRDPSELLGEFTARRTESIALVETLTPADLERGGDHPEVGWLTARDLLHEWIHHDANHLRQILANVQAYTWPQMGNAQRFSLPEGETD
jgi:hypothetical protein